MKLVLSTIVVKHNNNPKSKRLVKGHEYKFYFVRGFYVLTNTQLYTRTIKDIDRKRQTLITL